MRGDLLAKPCLCLHAARHQDGVECLLATWFQTGFKQQNVASNNRILYATTFATFHSIFTASVGLKQRLASGELKQRLASGGLKQRLASGELKQRLASGAGN